MIRILLSLLLVSSLMSCASHEMIGIKYKKREENNTFEIKVNNVDGCKVTFPKLDRGSSTIINKNESLEITCTKLNKKNRTVNVSHPDFETQKIVIKKTPRLLILGLDMLFPYSLLVDVFKSDFYKISKKSKKVNVTMNITNEGLNRKINQCITELNIEKFKALMSEYPDKISKDKQREVITTIVDKSLNNSVQALNITSYNQVVASYSEFINSTRIDKDRDYINTNLELIETSDKISNYLRNNSSAVLYLDMNEKSAQQLFNQSRPNVFSEDRFNAKGRALDLSKIGLIKQKVNPINPSGEGFNFGIGFWYKPSSNQTQNTNIQCNDLMIHLNNSSITLNPQDLDPVFKYSFISPLKENEWHYIYIDVKIELKIYLQGKKSKVTVYIDKESSSYDFDFCLIHPEEISFSGDATLDEFAIYEYSKSRDQILQLREMNLITVEALLEEQRKIEEEKKRLEQERLAKIEEQKRDGTYWIIGKCMSKTTYVNKSNVGVYGSMGRSGDRTEQYCFNSDGKCSFSRGHYPFSNEIGYPEYIFDYVEENYTWELNKSKDLIHIYSNGFAKETYKYNIETHKISSR